MTLRAKTARVRGHTAEKWDGGSWAWHEWTLRTPELKINLGPSGQPSCPTSESQKAEGPSLGSHRQGLDAGLKLRTPIAYPCGREGQYGSAGAGLLLPRPPAEQQTTGLQGLWAALAGEGTPGARSQP